MAVAKGKTRIADERFTGQRGRRMATLAARMFRFSPLGTEFLPRKMQDSSHQFICE
jgi:hypothetical protein